MFKVVTEIALRDMGLLLIGYGTIVTGNAAKDPNTDI